ncbi:hypothetical protein CSA57_06045 [candidate division KSB3 bacterium]|nr:MAG: hypothetical protein CSA57_06045 [candidate division KSB3 bacterium]
MKKILVISGDILPYPGFPTTGAGLRAWGIGKGLEAKGHTVVLAMPHMITQRFEQIPASLSELFYTPKQLMAFIRKHRPDVVVLQHWRLADLLDESFDLPLVIDFHGPLLLETQFQENPMLNRLGQEKIAALQKADFFTCAGEIQRHYFFPWLMMAGCNLREDLIQVVPVSLSPDLPRHHSQDEEAFVYGGVFLPWQDPVSGLLTLVERLEARQQGILKFFGGKHPLVTLPTGKFENLRRTLEKSSRVQLRPMVPREQLIQVYCRSHVAVDLMQRNAERELAFTTRTVEYLWCGLPVIYNDYAELSGYIARYDAGWTLDPDNNSGLRDVIDEILGSPELVATKAQNAQTLVKECLTWEKTIAPLDEFCRNPQQRTKGKALLDAASATNFRKVQDIFHKIQFHVQHEGVLETAKQAWNKLLR